MLCVCVLCDVCMHVSVCVRVNVRFITTSISAEPDLSQWRLCLTWPASPVSSCMVVMEHKQQMDGRCVHVCVLLKVQCTAINWLQCKGSISTGYI